MDNPRLNSKTRESCAPTGAARGSLCLQGEQRLAGPAGSLQGELPPLTDELLGLRDRLLGEPRGFVDVGVDLGDAVALNFGQLIVERLDQRQLIGHCLLPKLGELLRLRTELGLHGSSSLRTKPRW